MESENVGRWKAFPPLGKSTKVMGGIGTLRMPPAPDGSRLVTLTISLNASAGIPLLVPADFPYVGYVVQGVEATWRPMAATWSERFPSTRGIPRGYLVLDGMPHVRRVIPGAAPVLIHPCAIMEYEDRNTRLFDFVFATAETSAPHWRGDVTDFFEHYKKDRNRFGEYLTAGDHIDPLWDSRFKSPEALRSVDQHADAQLTLLGARVRESMLGPSATEALVRLLTQHSLDDLKRFGTQSQTPPTLWFRGGTSADEAVQLVTEARRRNTFELLVETYAREYPAAFRSEASR